MSGPSRRVPAWVMAVIVVAALPAAAFPTMLSMSAEGMPGRTYLWFYPAYVLATAVLAWQCYGRRSEMTWILIVMMLLTHAAMWYLVLA